MCWLIDFGLQSKIISDAKQQGHHDVFVHERTLADCTIQDKLTKDVYALAVNDMEAMTLMSSYDITYFKKNFFNKLPSTNNMACIVNRERKAYFWCGWVIDILQKNCQWVLLLTCWNKLQEDLHRDVRVIMYNGQIAITKLRGTRGLQDKMDEGNTDKHNDGYNDGGPLREAIATPPDLQGDT